MEFAELWSNGEDRITFNLRNKDNQVKLILHMGATRKESKGAAPVIEDKFGLVEWNSDIRGAVSFADLDDVRAKREQLKEIIELC